MLLLDRYYARKEYLNKFGLLLDRDQEATGKCAMVRRILASDITDEQKIIVIKRNFQDGEA